MHRGALMRKISLPSKAKLFVAIMYAEEEASEKALALLKKKLGEVEAKSEAYDFNFTGYYAREMGKNLRKKFAVFRELIDRDSLAKIKIFTGSVEKKLARNGRRRVNLDPGYITPASVVLATTKEFPHRVYLGRGIFAEVTLAFSKSDCEFFPWTYVDYRQRKVCEFFLRVRSGFLEQLRKE